jgi:hypothetical protein
MSGPGPNRSIVLGRPSCVPAPGVAAESLDRLEMLAARAARMGQRLAQGPRDRVAGPPGSSGFLRGSRHRDDPDGWEGDLRVLSTRTATHVWQSKTHWMSGPTHPHGSQRRTKILLHSIRPRDHKTSPLPRLSNQLEVVNRRLARSTGASDC